MVKKGYWLLTMGFFLAVITVFAETSMDEILLKPVYKDTPAYKRLPDNEYGKKYKLKMVKVKNYPQIKVPPQNEATVLYYGEVEFGNPLQSYGILVDFEGQDKMLWVDSNGDGDFANEQSYAIFKSDRFPNINVYYSPVPLNFQVNYVLADHPFQTQLQFDLLYLLIAKNGFEDSFYLKNRTWFTGILTENDQDYNVALVDTDDNGLYNDPEDLIFIDRDFDLNFSNKEQYPIKKLKTFKLKSKTKYEMDLQSVPEQITIKKDER